MDMGLNGKVVWVTGATGAIGRQIALGFAREGARVAASARTPDALAALVDEINAGGGDAMSVPLDVTDAAAVKATAENIVGTMGQIDVLSTTVAVPAFGPFLEIDADVFRMALEVKYLGYINCFQAALPHMIARETGAIVAITGTGGKLPISIHLPGGSVNASSPGPIMSERQQQMIDSGMSDPAKGIPLGRMGNAVEVADSVVFLASDRASYITGQILGLDGGGIKAL